jgi:hypothetical protein
LPVYCAVEVAAISLALPQTGIAPSWRCHGSQETGAITSPPTASAAARPLPNDPDEAGAPNGSPNERPVLLLVTDPNLLVLRLEPRVAELWDSPASEIVDVFEIIKAKLTGAKPHFGENRKATVTLS